MALTRLFIAISIFVISAEAFAQNAGSAGMDRILKGAGPGTSLASFQAEHPKAVDPAPEVPLETAEPLEAPAAPRELTLTEDYEQDPLMGLRCFADYGFRDGALREFVVIWGGDQDAINRHRKTFLEAAFWKHGREFTREVMQINPRSENPALVPVLRWNTPEAVYLASLAWNPDSEKAPGTFTYAMYAVDDPFLSAVLLGSKLAPEVVQDAWAELNPLLNELLQVGVVPAPGATP